MVTWILSSIICAAAQLFENRLCGGDSLEVELNWPQVQNHQAIGARLLLHTSTGTYLRDVLSVAISPPMRRGSLWLSHGRNFGIT